MKGSVETFAKPARHPPNMWKAKMAKAEVGSCNTEVAHFSVAGGGPVKSEAL